MNKFIKLFLAFAVAVGIFLAGIAVAIQAGINFAKKVAQCATGLGFAPISFGFKVLSFIVDPSSPSGDAGKAFTLTQEQGQVAGLIIGIGRARGLPDRKIVIALATAWQESTLRNLNYGDRDSLGIYQQRPSQGWGTPEQIMDPVYSINTFYDRLDRLANIDNMTVAQAAQAVQISAFPDAYAKWQGKSEAVLRAAEQKELGSVAVVGDSLTVGVDQYLTADLAFSGWQTINVDGQGSRATAYNPVGYEMPGTTVGKPGEIKKQPLVSGIAAVKRLKEQGIDPPAWIVALGTNDVASIVSIDDAQSLIDEMVKTIGREKKILWIGLYVPKYQNKVDIFNAALLQYAQENPLFVVADWATSAKANPDWISKDGVHYTGTGNQQRSKFIASASTQMEAITEIPGDGSSVADTFDHLGNVFSPCNVGKTITDKVMAIAGGQYGFIWGSSPQIAAGLTFIDWVYNAGNDIFSDYDPGVTAVSSSDIVPTVATAEAGDIVMWGDGAETAPGLINRRGLYLGNQQVIVEPEVGEVVTVTNIDWKGVKQIIRPRPSKKPANGSGWQKPLKKGYIIAASFGNVTDPVTRQVTLHDGVTLAGTRGEKVLSAGPGTIAQISYEPVNGNTIVINSDGGVQVTYAHLETIHPDLAVGNAVTAGLELGTIGNCGCQASVGPQLLFRIHVNDVPYNPVRFLNEKGIDLTKTNS